MDQLIKTLPTILRAAGDSEAVTQAACFAAWNHAVGEGLRNNVVPVRFEDKRLVVAVRDAIWQRQLKSMIGQMIFRVNAVLGQPVVKNIELQIHPELISNGQAAMSKTDRSLHNVPQELLFAAGRISDPALRRAFLGAAGSCLNRLARNSEL